MTRSKPETGLQARIVDALGAIGVKCTRIQCGGVKVRRGYMQLAEPGTPDLLVELWRTSWLETKTTTGRFEDAQPGRHRELERSGSRVAVVRSVPDALAVVRRWRAEDAEVEAMRRERVALEKAGLA